MWEFLGMIWEQLGETFIWFFYGFLGTIVFLFILFKYNVLRSKTSFGIIKKAVYYIFIPLYIGILSWFYSATNIVVDDAQKLADITIEKIGGSILSSFYNYAISFSESLDFEAETKEEFVDTYLTKNGYKKDSYTTIAYRWALVNGIDLLEKKAIESGDMSFAGEKFNIPQLISDYFNGNDNVAMLPFKYLKGMSNNSIKKYASSFYWIYFIMFLIVILLLAVDILINYRRKKLEINLINPAESIELHQDKLANSQKQIE